ncbi:MULTISPECIES: DNA repair protein RecO [Maribacter]|uniref:DNA repair protein RecO n=1 Tax=Maribacter stanieri TaxID=440514 RepID=A0A1I6HLH0_9FLAO|nr:MULTISPECIES: DNA repair protein RecO [Maribacter]SFR55130.1 DNA replication and repair protein RecO [Maribacter stanieri]|tara:strand:- start:90 stop:818 length:729 start_codon:yes stop_codon:yes gene_type:complete
MQVTTKAIVFSAIKYGDTSLIVKAFTASDGIKSYLLRGVLASKKGKLKSAYFQPLTQLEIVANHKNKGTLETIKEAKVSYHYQTLYADMAKNAMTLFLAELLGNSIREEEQNEDLFEYLIASLQWLDMNKDVANFHLYFMLSLTRFLGFYPDVYQIDKPYFDLLEGEFVAIESLNPILRGENIYYFKTFLGINFDAMHTVKMKKTNRQELLKSLILYFELHLQGFRKPKSLAVLNEVFNTYV